MASDILQNVIDIGVKGAFLISKCDKDDMIRNKFFNIFFKNKYRLWWITAFTLSFWMCAESIEITWKMWLENPVSLSFTDKPMLISEIPFPTVMPEPAFPSFFFILDVSY